MKEMNKHPLRIRRKRKYKSPNPLFEKWLMEWKEEAAAKGLKTQFIFGKALSSLRKYPLPLSSGKEAKVLEYFGDKICSMLDERLRQHNAESVQDAATLKDVPPPLSAVTDYNQPNAASQTSVLAKNPKGKVSSSHPISIILPSVDIGGLDPPVDYQDEEEVETFCLLPGEFDILLCVDSCETASGHSAGRKHYLSELQKCGVPFEVRKLSVGDFIWIAKERNTSVQRELVLDFIVERKRMDDLAHSIKDGRFREQKFRLRNCGLRCPVYLVECHGSQKYLGLPETTLEQAIVNTQIVDGFIVKRTRDVKESVAYLSSVTKYLQSMLQGQALLSGSRKSAQRCDSSCRTYMTFEEFSLGGVKNKCLTVQEMFTKHLLQFHGLSVDRAAAIVNCFQTPARMFEMLESCRSENDQVSLIAEIKYGKYQRKISQALGKTVQKFYTSQLPLT